MEVVKPKGVRSASARLADEWIETRFVWSLSNVLISDVLEEFEKVMCRSIFTARLGNQMLP